MIKAELLDHCGSDLSVVNAARVSFHKESGLLPCGDLPTKDAKLIHYLAKHKHKSPFNHCFASFRVKAPIFVARQLVKHEYLPWNEVSRRYVDEEPEFYVPKAWRGRAKDKKQGSSDEAVSDEYEGRWGYTSMRREYTAHCDESLGFYLDLLKAGVSPEQARMVLPQSMMTEWIWSGTLGAFAKMAALRLDSHTQEETREVAEAISVHMKQLFPVSWEALSEYPIL